MIRTFEVNGFDKDGIVRALRSYAHQDCQAGSESQKYWLRVADRIETAISLILWEDVVKDPKDDESKRI